MSTIQAYVFQTRFDNAYHMVAFTEHTILL